MKMLKNFSAAKLNFAMSTTAAKIGAQMRRSQARQSVPPRGWIGSYPRSINPLCLGAPADPLLAPLVHLLLPERDVLLERVDRVLARSEGVLAVRSGDGDDDRGLAEVDAA